MSFPFNEKEGLVLVRARVWDPTNEVVLKLALDIGSTGTVISRDLLILAGYDPNAEAERVTITTASGEVSAPIIHVQKLEALGASVVDFGVVCHTLPREADVDGLLGLDFFRKRCLTLDFRIGQIELELHFLKKPKLPRFTNDEVSTLD